jgi:hypothetical protein
MNEKIVICLISLLFSVAQIGLAQNNYSYVDRHARKVSQKNILGIKPLVAELIGKDSNEFSKVRAIYTWIKLNMSYDHQRAGELHTSNYSDYIANEILTAHPETFLLLKKGICSDFALLAKAMCDCAGIECSIVRGVAKSIQLNDSFCRIDTAGHAWNAVRLNHQWYLMDCTWSEDYFYFLTKPEWFVLTHYPYDLQWLLTKDSVSRNTFLNMPYIKKDYFQMMYPDFPVQGDLIAIDNHVEIKNLSNKPMIFLLWKEGSGDSTTDAFFTPKLKWARNKKTKKGFYSIILPSKGRYILMAGVRFVVSNNLTMEYPNLIFFKIFND